jgi:hypothetical protein
MPAGTLGHQAEAIQQKKITPNYSQVDADGGRNLTVCLAFGFGLLHGDPCDSL